MERAEIRQLSADMIAVPIAVWNRMESLYSDMLAVHSRLDFLESVSVTSSEYLTRQQAMQFLQVGSTKLWEIRNAGDIETSDATGKTLYKTSSCRDYLSRSGYSQAHVQQRFREILLTKQKK